MPSIFLRKFVLTGLLLAIWFAGAGLMSRPTPYLGRMDATFDCCRVSPAVREADNFSRPLLPRMHSDENPCCNPPAGQPRCLTSFQRPDSPLPENPTPVFASLIGRRHQLYAVGATGFFPRSDSPVHPTLPLLATVVLLN